MQILSSRSKLYLATCWFVSAMLIINTMLFRFRKRRLDGTKWQMKQPELFLEGRMVGIVT
jgi:hypothetical protein